MSATTGSAIKATLEAGGFGIPWFRDRAPQHKANGDPQLPPLGIIQDSLSLVPQRTGDGKHKRATELVQVDIYEPITKPDNTRGEDYTLAESVHTYLLTARITTAPKRVWRIDSITRTRVPTLEANQIRHSLSLTLRRNLQS